MCVIQCSGKGGHLKWETRVKILRDCSFALKYLHHHIEGCVVHRDIKVGALNQNLDSAIYINAHIYKIMFQLALC